MLHYICDQSIFLKDCTSYLLILYLNVDVAKERCRSPTIILNMIRSLKKSIDAYNNDDYPIYSNISLDDLYYNIFNDKMLHRYFVTFKKIDYMMIRYQTPDKRYGKTIKYRFNNHEICYIETKYLFPQRYTEYEDYLQEYINKDKILKNRYDFDSIPITFCVERVCRHTLYTKTIYDYKDGALGENIKFTDIFLDRERYIRINVIYSYLNRSYVGLGPTLTQKNICDTRSGNIMFMIVYDDNGKMRYFFDKDGKRTTSFEKKEFLEDINDGW